MSSLQYLDQSLMLGDPLNMSKIQKQKGPGPSVETRASKPERRNLIAEP